MTASNTPYGLTPIPDSQAPAPPTWGPYVDYGGRSWGQWHPFFGSSHAGGANFCMADGAVRLVAFTVDNEVFRRMSLARDQLPVQLP